MQSIEALVNSQRGDSDEHLTRPAEVSKGGEHASRRQHQGEKNLH